MWTFFCGLLGGVVLTRQYFPVTVNNIIERPMAPGTALVGGTIISNQVMHTSIYSNTGLKLAEMKVNFLTNQVTINLDPMAQFAYEHGQEETVDKPVNSAGK